MCYFEGNLRDNDVVICFNYRSDRMRELVTALCLKREFDYTTEIKVYRYTA